MSKPTAYLPPEFSLALTKLAVACAALEKAASKEETIKHATTLEQIVTSASRTFRNYPREATKTACREASVALDGLASTVKEFLSTLKTNSSETDSDLRKNATEKLNIVMKETGEAVGRATKVVSSLSLSV